MLLSRRCYRNPGHHALGYCGIIAWWVCAVVPYRCRRGWGGRRHTNVGGGGDPTRGHIEEYPPMRMRIKAVHVSKLVAWNEMTMIRAATAEPTMPLSVEAPMSPPVPRACVGIGCTPHE